MTIRFLVQNILKYPRVFTILLLQVPAARAQDSTDHHCELGVSCANPPKRWGRIETPVQSMNSVCCRPYTWRIISATG